MTPSTPFLSSSLQNCDCGIICRLFTLFQSTVTDLRYSVHQTCFDYVWVCETLVCRKRVARWYIIVFTVGHTPCSSRTAQTFGRHYNFNKILWIVNMNVISVLSHDYCKASLNRNENVRYIKLKFLSLSFHFGARCVAKRRKLFAKIVARKL